MFKKIIVFVVFTLAIFMPYAPLLAQDYGVGAFSEGAGYSTDKRDVYAIIDTIVSVFLSMIAIITFLLLLYGGIRWMTAQGNDDKVQQAKDIIQAAAIGLAIVLAAYGITYFVFSRLAK